MESYVFIYLGNEWVPAGKLVFNDQGRGSYSRFAYGRRYLARADAIAIDPIGLPLKDKEFETEEGFYIFNCLRDSGPDKWGRYLIERQFARALNELEYVLATGPERVGALAFGTTLTRPSILRSEGYSEYLGKYFELSEHLTAVDTLLGNADLSDLKEYLQYGPSLGGARPKAAVLYMGAPYIAKFSTSLDSRRETLIEYATMSLAAKAGLTVPEIMLERVDNRDVYLIKRFDRQMANRLSSVQESHPRDFEPLEFIPCHFISGLSACGLHESDYELWSYPRLCQAISKISNRPIEDKHELFRRMVFNILVNNDDDHPRNHGFIHVGKNKWRLSPLYDVVPRDQVATTFRLAQHIGDYGKEASKKNALSACHHFALTVDQAKLIWEELATLVMEQWRPTFLDVGLDSGEIDRFAKSIGVENK